MIKYVDKSEGITPENLKGFFIGWPKHPSPAKRPHDLAIRDYNHDNKLDIAVAIYGTYGASNLVDVFFGDGTGFFSSPVSYEVGQGPESIVAADFNGDGNLDLATNNNGFGGEGIETMSVLLGSSNGTFQQAVTYPGAFSGDLLGTTGITAGDVNHDSFVDILVTNGASNDISIYLNNGNGSFTYKLRAGAWFDPFSPIYEDFDGDSIKDLAVRINPRKGSLLSSVIILKGVNAPVGIEPGSNNTPKNFSLYQNYPNPFNPVTSIKYSISKVSSVKLVLYDVLGREIAVLINDILQPDTYSSKWDASNYSSGVYFYGLTVKPLDGSEQEFTDTKKMVLMK